MTEKELDDIIRSSEVSQVQFKERIDDNYSIGTELVAFSNTRGGTLVIGINDKTAQINALSYEELQDTNQKLSNIATQNVDPRIGIETDSVEVDGGHVVIVTVKEGLNKPYKDNKGIIWAKQGSDKRRIVDNSEIAEMMEECGTFIAEVAAVDATIDDLDLNEFKEYLLKRFETPLRKSGIKPADYDGKTLEEIIAAISRNMTIERLMTNLRFMRPDGRLTLAGLLLFGRMPQLFRPTLTAKCISFYGKSIGGSMFRDRVNDADMEGNLRHQYDTIMAFFRRNLRYVQPGKEFNTQGVLEVSDLALSELVMNALIHRSLVRPAPIRIFILDDRIEIHSPGNLPRGLNVSDVEKGISMPRNGQLFYHANFILPYSGAGTGIQRALDERVEMKFVNDEQIREFIVIIPRKMDDEPVGNQLATEKNGQVEEGKSNQANAEKSNQVNAEKSNQVNAEKSNQVTVEKSNQVDISENIDIERLILYEKSKKSNQVRAIKSNQVENKKTDQVETGKSNQVEVQRSNQVTQRVKVTKKQKDVINFCSVPRSAQEIMDRLGIDNQSTNRKRHIQVLIDLGYLKPLFPESLNAPNQKYVKVKRK